MRKAIQLAQLTADAHPESVRLLFKRYKIQKEPGAQPIIDAYLVYGEPFLRDLFEIVYQGMSQFSDALGLETDKLLASAADKKAQAAALETEKKKGFWDGFLNVFNNAGSVLTGATSIYQGISALISGKSVDTGVTGQSASQTELQNQMYQVALQEQQAREANRTKTWLLIGAGVLIAALVIVMFIKKK
jgi:hypothetical protein